MGTTCPSLIPDEDKPKGSAVVGTPVPQSENPIYTVYEKDVGWRSFRQNSINCVLIYANETNQVKEESGD